MSEYQRETMPLLAKIIIFPIVALFTIFLNPILMLIMGLLLFGWVFETRRDKYLMNLMIEKESSYPAADMDHDNQLFGR
jgi:hypothetical protein